MIAVVCIDDNNGMTFNHRRQSRDRLLIADLLTLCEEKVIRMKAYSQPLFEDHDDRIVVDEDYLEQAGDEDVCFVETDDLTPYAERLTGMIVYRWNRKYPVSTKLTVDLSAFTLQSTAEFAGNSHDVITREVYTR